MSTNTNTKAKKGMSYLEKRIRYLEDVNRFTLDALEMVASLGDFQPSVNKLQDASVILDETGSRIRSLIPLKAMAFYLVNEENNEFTVSRVDPLECRAYIEEEVGFFIDDGIFAWTLREKRPVIVSSKRHDRRFILHVMTTSSRIRGMFVGLLENGGDGIPDVSLSMLSIILLNSSNALESRELYNMVRGINENIQRKKNYKMLFEAAPDGVEVLDARGSIVDCNRAQAMLLGYDRGELIGKHTTRFFCNGTNNSLFEESMRNLKDQGYFEGEIELVGKTGTAIPVWRKGSAIYDEKEKFVGCVVYNRDLSGRKQADEERRKLEFELKQAQKMEAIGTLAGGVAHDLNNVLGGLVSYPDLLLMQIPDDSPLRKPILTIQKSGKKAAAIVQDLLTLARRGVNVSEVANLNDIVSDHFKTPEHEKMQAVHPHIRFETALEKQLPGIVGSPVHLSKTVMNLLSNAAEAMPDGGTVTISTGSRYVDRPIAGYASIKEGEYVTLTVSDEGTGMSEEDKRRVFEPFYTKKVMGRSGTGLGMAVVWGTVKDHSGYIDIQSTEGKGTTITVYFPVTMREAKKADPLVPIAAYRSKGEAVLIVDDMEEQREIISGMLHSLGYAVSSVSSGEEAIKYLETHPVDLLLLDMIMNTGMDGLETYRRILKIRPHQKALIISGFSETRRVKEAQHLGVGSYIRKPFVLEQIGMAVREELDR
ncbi:MAG: response regulator [Deltaproteobacteria bacterium]|nr:response regulator [Deltaproteobacteria bacterium]